MIWRFVAVKIYTATMIQLNRAIKGCKNTMIKELIMSYLSFSMHTFVLLFTFPFSFVLKDNPPLEFVSVSFVVFLQTIVVLQ